MNKKYWEVVGGVAWDVLVNGENDGQKCQWPNWKGGETVYYDSFLHFLALVRRFFFRVGCMDGRTYWCINCLDFGWAGKMVLRRFV